MTTYYVTTLIVLVLFTLAQRVRYRVVLLGAGEKADTALCSILFSMAALVLILVAGLRYRVGADYGAYYLGYREYADTLWERIKALDEPGYPLIAKSAILLGGGGALSLLLASFVTHTLNLRTMYKNTDQLLYAGLLYIFLGCWHGEFNAVRQCLAGAFVFAGYAFLRDKRFWPYAFCVFIAFLCHRSAILMIVPFFFVHRRISVPNIMLLMAGAAAIIVAENFVFTATEGLLAKSLNASDLYLNTRVNILRTLVRVSPAVFFLFVLHGREKTEEETFYLNILVFHAAVSIATSGSAYYARFPMYTDPFLCIVIPELSKRISGKNRRIIMTAMMALYFFFWRYEIANSESLRSFAWIWQR